MGGGWRNQSRELDLLLNANSILQTYFDMKTSITCPRLYSDRLFEWLCFTSLIHSPLGRCSVKFNSSNVNSDNAAFTKLVHPPTLPTDHATKALSVRDVRCLLSGPDRESLRVKRLGASAGRAPVWPARLRALLLACLVDEVHSFRAGRGRSHLMQHNGNSRANTSPRIFYVIGRTKREEEKS